MRFFSFMIRPATVGVPVWMGVPRNCFRCGADFVDFSEEGRKRVCPECRKPREKMKRYSSDVLQGQSLTRRETQIADLIAMGKPNKEIAYDLHLSEGSIKVWVSIVLAKTRMANRTALAVYWVNRKPD